MKIVFEELYSYFLIDVQFYENIIITSKPRYQTRLNMIGRKILDTLLTLIN